MEIPCIIFIFKIVFKKHSEIFSYTNRIQAQLIFNMNNIRSTFWATVDNICSWYLRKDWQVTVINNTKGEAKPGREATIMLFQVLSGDTIDKGYSSAWLVERISSPGRVGPIPFPKKAKFGALDTRDGISRLTGPFDVECGQIVSIIHQDPEHPPKIEISGEPNDTKDLKVTNASGNAKALDVALYKCDKKLVSFKDLKPNQEVGFLVEPAIYIVDVGDNVSEGDDFLVSVHASRATKIVMSEEKRDVKIEITQTENEQLHFSEI